VGRVPAGRVCRFRGDSAWRGLIPDAWKDDSAGRRERIPGGMSPGSAGGTARAWCPGGPARRPGSSVVQGCASGLTRAAGSGQGVGEAAGEDPPPVPAVLAASTTSMPEGRPATRLDPPIRRRR